MVLPERVAIEPKTCTPAYLERFLSRRFTEGNKSVRLLFAEVKKQGYTGSYSHLARFIAPWKDDVSGKARLPHQIRIEGFNLGIRPGMAQIVRGRAAHLLQQKVA
jgi:hypothetical protein